MLFSDPLVLAVALWQAWRRRPVPVGHASHPRPDTRRPAKLPVHFGSRERIGSGASRRRRGGYKSVLRGAWVTPTSASCSARAAQRWRRRRPGRRSSAVGIVLALCLCCCAPRLRADEGRRRAPGGGYRVRAVAVDEGETQLRAELELEAAATGASAAAYGEDVRKLDVYARCDS